MEEMCTDVDVAVEKEDCMSRKTRLASMMIKCSDERKASDKVLSEKGLLKKCEKINKSYKFVPGESTFVKEFSKKQEDLKHKSCCYRPKIVLINNKKTEQQYLGFVINVVKQEGKNDTISDIDINSIRTKYYTLTDDFGLDLDIYSTRRINLTERCRRNRHNVISAEAKSEEYVKIEKAGDDEKQEFKLGRSSLSFDYSDGADFTNIDDDLIRLIYSEMKPKFGQMLISFKNYIDDSDKFVAVLYSGGKDSTCRVLELLNEGYNVLPLVNTFNIHNTTDLLIRDIAVIHNLYHIYKKGSFKGKLYQPRFLSYTSFRFDYDYQGLNQQPYNVVSLALLGREFYNRCIRIEMCLIGGDIGVSYISEIKKLYNAALKFNCSCGNSIKTLPPLTFPYIKYTKSEIINCLSSQLDEIYSKDYFIPTCQETIITNINLQYLGNRTYLVIRFKFCGHCNYCRNYLLTRDEDGIDVSIPLKDISFYDGQNVVLHSENIYKMSNRFANLYSAL